VGGGLGLGLEPRRWADLLSADPAQPTLQAFSAALLLDPTAPCRHERSYLAILSRYAGIEEAGVTLEAALAALRALQREPGPVAFAEREAAALSRAWSSASEEVRLAVLGELDVRRTPEFAGFLWD